MSEKQYSVIIQRWEESSDPVDLIDQYISADDAIDLMMHIKENVADASEEEEEEVEAVVIKKTTSKSETRAYKKYDIQAAREDLIGGMKPGAVAKKHNVAPDTIYGLKNKLKKAGELDGNESQPVQKKSPTCSKCGEEGHYAKKCEENIESSEVGSMSNDDKIRNMIEHGKTDQEIHNNMHDYMTKEQINESIKFARLSV